MASTASQTVLVAGGGIGGIATANRLRRRLDRRHRVVLINREPDFTFAASYLWVMTDARRPNQITRPLQRLERRGIEVVIGDGTDIDPETRTVTVGGQRMTGDDLVISLGADWATDRSPAWPNTVTPSPHSPVPNDLPNNSAASNPVASSLSPLRPCTRVRPPRTRPPSSSTPVSAQGEYATESKSRSAAPNQPQCPSPAPASPPR